MVSFRHSAAQTGTLSGTAGTLTRTKVPPASPLVISILPFIISVRSRIDTSPSPGA